MEKKSPASKDDLVKEIRDMLESTRAQNDALQNLIAAIGKDEEKKKNNQRTTHQNLKP